MLCTQVGIASGLFNQHTQHGFAEHDANVQHKIARKMQKLGCEWEPRFWRGELHDLALRAMFDNKPLEFAYLDLCSCMTSRIARWGCTELGPALAEGATVAVTLQRSWRHNLYMNWWCHVNKKRGTDAFRIYQLADEMIRTSPCTGVVGDLLSFYDDSRSSADDSLSLSIRDRGKTARMLRPEYHTASVDALSSFMILFPMHTFKLDACIEYKRGTGTAAMSTFVLTDFRRVDKPTMSKHMLKQLGDNVSPQLRLASF